MQRSDSNRFYNVLVFFCMVSWVALGITATPDLSFADESIRCTSPAPYEAPQYIEPIWEPEISKIRLIDNGVGTISVAVSGLLWTKKDSYADFGKCLSWLESSEYVEKLDTGNYTDWRMPTIAELATIYDPTKRNNMAWDHNPEYPLALDKKFADGAAYWYWTSDAVVEKERGCAKTMYFVQGFIHFRNIDQCNNGGIRAVRTLNVLKK